MDDTLPLVYRPLMEAESVVLPYCAICGRTYPLERHHIVWRSWGKLFRDGKEVQKPVITLCGRGNNLRDADGRLFCHGRAHNRMLHFRYEGELQCLETAEPTDYMSALEMNGWRPVDGYHEDVPF